MSALLSAAITLPNGGVVRGRGLRYPTQDGPAPDYGLYLGSVKLRHKHAAELAWPHDWLVWPDFMLPRDRSHAIERIHALAQRVLAAERVEVACGGGVGRTGTVLACLAVVSGLSPREAIDWTRVNHHRRAVETPWQRAWVGRFPAERPTTKQT